jgi:hypothetical protein
MGQELIPASPVAQERVVKASDIALDGGTVPGVFTISGGPILPLALIMIITEAVSAHPCAINLALDIDLGSDINLTTAGEDINATQIGDIWEFTGNIAGVFAKRITGTALPKGLDPDFPLILPPGEIDLVLANSDPTSGIADFYMRYKPIAAGAFVIGS